MSYDPKAVKISKELKVLATSTGPETQNQFIKRFVKIAETNFTNYQSRNKRDK